MTKRIFPNLSLNRRPYPRVECATVRSFLISTAMTRAPALVRTLVPDKAKNTPGCRRLRKDSGNTEETQDTRMEMLTYTVIKGIIPTVQLSPRISKDHSATLLHGMMLFVPTL
jgi:hypothetical protein